MIAALALVTVLVHQNDTLSGIAASHGDTLAVVEADNSQIANPNLIFPGEVVHLPGGATATWSSPSSSTADHEPDGDSDDPVSSAPASSPVTSAPVQQSAPVTGASTGVSGGFQSCVIQHESTGNAAAVNPSSGAGGLYQFMPSTWASLGYGGSPQNAPVWEQNQAFQKLFAQQGAAPWAGDGC